MLGVNLVDYFDTSIGPVKVSQGPQGIAVSLVCAIDEAPQNFLLSGEHYAKGLLESRSEDRPINCLHLLTQSGRVYRVGFQAESMACDLFEQPVLPFVMRSKETGFTDIALYDLKNLLGLQEVLEEGQSKLRLRVLAKCKDTDISTRFDGASPRPGSRFAAVHFGTGDFLLLNCENLLAEPAGKPADAPKTASVVMDSGSDFFEEFPIVVYLSRDRSKLEAIRAVGYDTIDPPRFEDEASVVVVIASPPINGLNKKKLLAALQAYHASDLINDQLREPYNICFEDLNFFSTDSPTADPDQLPGLCFLVKTFKKMRAGLPELQAVLTSFPTEEEQMAMAMEESRKADELLRKAQEKEIADKELENKATFINFCPDFFRMARADLPRLKKLVPVQYWKDSLEQRSALFGEFKRKVKDELAARPETPLESLLDFRVQSDALVGSNLFQKASAEDKHSLEIGLAGLRLLCHFYVGRLAVQPSFQGFLLEAETQAQGAAWLPGNLQTSQVRLPAGSPDTKYFKVNRMRAKNLTTLKRQNFSLLRQLAYAIDESFCPLAERPQVSSVRFQFLGERKPG